MQSVYRRQIKHLVMQDIECLGKHFKNLIQRYVFSSGTGTSWSSFISDMTLPFAYEVTVHETISHLENLSGLALTKCTRPSASAS